MAVKGSESLQAHTHMSQVEGSHQKRKVCTHVINPACLPHACELVSGHARSSFLALGHLLCMIISIRECPWPFLLGFDSPSTPRGVHTMGLGGSRGFARFCGVWELQVGFAGDGSGFSVFFGISRGVLRGFSVFFGV